MGPGSQTIIVTIALTAASSFFVCLRCISRFGIRQNYGIDDFLIICASAFSIIFTILIRFQVKHGLGDENTYLDAHEFGLMMKFFYAAIPFYHSGLAMVKDSILFQYLRFFPPSKLRKLCWFMIIFTSLYGLAAVIWGFLLCLPVQYIWDRSISGKCAVLEAAYANAGIAILSDIVICLMPVHVLRSLQVSTMQKHALIGVFVLGGFSCIAAIIRVPSVIKTVKSPVFGANDNESLLWSSIELNTGMIAACLPTLKQLVLRIAPKSLHNSSTEHSSATRSKIASTAPKSIHALTRLEIEEGEMTICWLSENPK